MTPMYLCMVCDCQAVQDEIHHSTMEIGHLLQQANTLQYDGQTDDWEVNGINLVMYTLILT